MNCFISILFLFLHHSYDVRDAPTWLSKEELPPYYQPWMDIALRVPELVLSHELRFHINKVSGDNKLTTRTIQQFMEPWFSADTPSLQMPLLSSQFLQKHRELRLAHLALSIMTMGYTWQGGESNTVEVSLCSLYVFVIHSLSCSTNYNTTILLQYINAFSSSNLPLQN